MGLYDRLRRLEQSGAWFPPEVTHGLGVPAEVVEAEWDRVFGPLAANIARSAERIREQRRAGKPLDELLRAEHSTDLMSLCASYGSWEMVPKPVLDALEAHLQSSEGNEMGVDLTRRFFHITITDAFERLNAEGAEQ